MQAAAPVAAASGPAAAASVLGLPALTPCRPAGRASPRPCDPRPTLCAPLERMGDVAKRLEQAQRRARSLREQIEEHYQKVSEHSISEFAKELGVDELGNHSLTVQRTLSGHFGKVYAMQWAGEGLPFNLVSASQDGKLIVWNAFTTNKQHVRAATERPRARGLAAVRPLILSPAAPHRPSPSAPRGS